MFSPKELEEFSNDCGEISGFFKDAGKVGEKGIDEVWCTTASILLKDFSNKWKTKIQKIGKK